MINSACFVIDTVNSACVFVTDIIHSACVFMIDMINSACFVIDTVNSACVFVTEIFHSACVFIIEMINSPDCDDLTHIQVNTVHLCNKDGRHCFIEGSSVHVHCSSHGQYETCHTFVNAVVFLQTAECDGESGSTEITNQTGILRG